MKIQQDDTAADWALRAVPQEYDAYPPILRFSVPRAREDSDDLHPDRLGLCAYLVFGPYTSGALELPEGISPALARAIETDAAPVPVRPAPVSYEAAKLPLGGPSVSVLRDAPAGPAGGFGAGASNAHLMGGDGPRRMELMLAAALLGVRGAAADEFVLDASSLRLEERAAAEQRLRRLAEPARLGIELTY
ncbi:hypothetical protein [Zhihengliuella flava]|uniref:Uncharacterized protein n=1 Tax=Zhihengliuella flava TaxID=1285193 RepID=A0A931DB84_9MICC|nr:hypothetical protein [Zhihengliuella flava]MBG6083535.1 hypothetical protein [Zhihengliuella flava]